MEIRDYLFGGDTRQMVYKSLDASAMRAKGIAHNLANVMTDFRRKEISFESELKKATSKLRASRLKTSIWKFRRMPFKKGSALRFMNQRIQHFLEKSTMLM